MSLGLLDPVATLLERSGVIDRSRLRRTSDLAWPRIVTGFSIMSKHAVDVALVGWAVGTDAVAGLAFAFAYWSVAKFVGLGLAGGTVSVVSRRYGAKDNGGASVAVAQSVYISLAAVSPFVLAYLVLSPALIGVFEAGPTVAAAGAVYLSVVAPALAFEFLNLTGSRTYAGVGDTFTPMVVRVGGAFLNILLSVAFVLWLGMGVVGVALGTLLSVAAVTVVLTWGMTGRDYPFPGMRPCPVPVGRSVASPDVGTAREILGVSLPLVGRKVADMLVIFPLLWVASSFGPLVVAAFEVGRRVRDLLSSFNWGFAMAASAIVGQELGGGDRKEAAAYGWSVLRLSVLVYLIAAVVVLLLAEPIASFFVSEAEEVREAAVFVRVAALSALALGANGAITGALLGAGDTRYPFAASLVGQYLLALPVAVAGLLTPLGVTGLYLAFVIGYVFPAVANYWRFRRGDWLPDGRRQDAGSEVGGTEPEVATGPE